ncbi:MAG: hypothetical protein ABFS56_33015 [Pseudomonadota bacterium]
MDYIIPTDVLFHALNVNRQNKGLTIIENALIARKLGILFTFKTNDRINFQDDMVNLNDAQLIILQDILEYYFNADMTIDIRAFAIKQADGQENRVANTHHESPLSQPENVGYFKKIKGFLKKNRR